MDIGRKCPDAEGSESNGSAGGCATLSSAEEQKAAQARRFGRLRNSTLGSQSDTCMVFDLPRVCEFDFGFSWLPEPWLCYSVMISVPKKSPSLAAHMATALYQHKKNSNLVFQNH